MRNTIPTAVIALAATTALFADDTRSAADPAPPAIAPPADQPVKPSAAPAAPGEAEPKPTPSAGDEVARVFPLEGEEWMKDPFLVLDFEMDAVVEDFKDGKARPPAETTQPRIISRFDAVIEQLEKKAGGAGPGNRPDRPAEQSTLAKGPGGMGELKTPRKTGKGYDDLTPREREKILQSKTEGFPPGFEDVLADYYRRLAKGDSASASESSEPILPKPEPK